jgi:RNA polymerase sigma factor (sigma-70 family)
MQPTNDKTELYNQLVDGCRQNKRDAQYRLYNILSGKMFAVCLRYAKDREGAEDILQDGFVKVFKNIDKYRGDGSFEGWVRKIIVNTAVEHYRKQAKMYTIVDETDAHFVEMDNTSDSLELEDIMKCIQKLSSGYRTVFNMYVIEGYAHKEIAELLGISEGTSKSQLARARYLLQKMINDNNQIKEQNVATN